MAFENSVSRDELASAISALDQAMYMHEQWSNGLYACLVCQLPPDERDLMDEPHRRCPFGQWYYGQGLTQLTEHPAFVAVAVEHEEVHRLGARLLQTSAAGEVIAAGDYDGFVNSLSRLRAEIAGLRHELQEAQTNRDPLTGASSRIGMLSRLRLQLEMVKRNVRPCTIAMMDLDLFKAVNDEYGHQAGDTVLVDTVRFVLGHLRPYDELFRYGGEEFLLCAAGTDLVEGLAAVERLREGIASVAIDVGTAQLLSVTASFGVTLLDPDVSVEVSIARADRALYVAKASGRNQTSVWDVAMT